MNYTIISEKGKVREKNEDDYLIKNKNKIKIFAVADGMGGHEAGDVASALAIETINDYEFKAECLDRDIKKAIKLANKKIYKQSKADNKKMGTTITLAIIKDDLVKIGHIGDSRAYIYNSKQLKQITKDHSYVRELVEKDLINEEEAKNHPQKNVLLKALGTESDPEIDLIETKFKQGNLILLCSDGLTNMVAEKKIQSILASNLNLEKKANKLVEIANKNGGHDNITVLIYKNN